MKVSQNPINLKKLLEGYLYFEVPPYQREYSWDIEQISDLYYDIENSDSTNGHFLGSVLVFCDDEKTKPAEIIDGQQRLATLFLLLNSIKNIFEKHNNIPLAEKIKDLIYIRDNHFTTDKKNDNPKLTIGNRDNKVFRALLRNENIKNIANKKIKSHKLLLKASEDFFENQLNQIFSSSGREGLLEFLNKVASTEFIVMTAEAKYDKILLFKTLNVRGLELSQSDLIKNEICKSPKGIKIEEAVEIWDEIKSILEDAKANIDLFLFHYINSLPNALSLRKEIDSKRKIKTQNEYTPFIPERYLFEAFELILLNARSTNTFLSDLKSAARDYVSFFIPNGDNIHLVGLRVLNITKCFPLLLKGKNILNKRNFKKLTKAVEIISFRHSMTRLDPKELEKLYYKLLPNLNSDRDIDQIIYEIKNHPTMSNEKRFKDEFFISSPKRIASKYILFRLASKFKEGLMWNSKEIHLEHIMPQKPKGEWNKIKKNDPELYSDYLDRIGNLTLLRDKLNIEASNKAFNAKKSHYIKSGLLINKEYLLLKYNKWGYKEIEDRQKNIFKILEDIWTI